MNIEDKLHFNLIDILSPEQVVNNFIENINKATQEYVTCVISNYDDVNLKAMNSNLFSSLQNLTTSFDDQHEIQSNLGEIDSSDKNYEIYLKVKYLEHYKYRLFFLGHSEISYPATIYLQKDLSSACLKQGKCIYTCETMNSLEDILEQILSSDYLIKLLQNLINESLRQEQVVQDNSEL